MTIISHLHRYIFVRTRKTASTSMEIELSRHAGSEDVIASFCGRDERLRRQAGGRGPQNHLEPGVPAQPVPTPPGPGAGVRYYNHMPAERIRELVGPRIWDEYFTFCFERNPWDKAVSLYFHRYRVEPRPSFMQFVASGEVADAVNYPLYHDGQRLLVDHIARYEQMSTETDYLFRRLQLPQPLSLLKAKSQFRQGDGSALMDGWSAAAIAEIFADELSLFGYRPPSWVGAADQRTPLPVRALEVHRAAN